MKRLVDLLPAVVSALVLRLPLVSVALLVKLTFKSCNRLAFASQYGHIGCVGVRLFMLSVAQLRLR
jgi:hypothetical protein